MKRSDMIEIIATTLYDNQFKCSKMQIYPIAEKLLHTIERNGMLPPARAYTFRELGHPNHVSADEPATEKVFHIWEKEND